MSENLTSRIMTMGSFSSYWDRIVSKYVLHADRTTCENKKRKGALMKGLGNDPSKVSTLANQPLKAGRNRLRARGVWKTWPTNASLTNIWVQWTGGYQESRKLRSAERKLIRRSAGARARGAMSLFINYPEKLPAPLLFHEFADACTRDVLTRAKTSGSCISVHLQGNCTGERIVYFSFSTMRPREDVPRILHSFLRTWRSKKSNE